MVKLKASQKEALDKHSKNLVPLKVGKTVLIQNQAGNKPKHWNTMAYMVEMHGHRQYSMKVDGEG